MCSSKDSIDDVVYTIHGNNIVYRLILFRAF